MAQVHATIDKNKYKTTILTNGLTFFADEPVELGGTNLGPNPKELLAGALAACTTITLRMYADRKEWALEDIKVDVKIDTETQPGTTLIHKKIELIGDLDDKTKERLLNIAEKCPVNKLLLQPIQMIKE